MKNRYSSIITNTPQTQVPVGHTDMVENNAGAYSFQITPQQQLERFLLLGTEGGTYYVGESKLTIENAKSIVDYIQKDGLAVVATLVDFARKNRAPKADPLIFVLALTMTYGNEATKKAAYDGLGYVCKNSTQLFMLIGDIQKMRGWSRGLRRAVARFYTGRTVDKLAYQLVKYRQRAGFTHRDVLRLAHPKTQDKMINTLLGYAVGKVAPHEVNNKLIQAFEIAQNPETTDQELINVILNDKLTWEMVPTDKLNNSKILTALLESMPLIALMRNLNRFAMAGLTQGNSEVTKTIVARLTDKVKVAETGPHPVNVVNTMLTYSSGQGFRGGNTWTPNQNIVDALDTLFYLAIDAVVPTKKSILFGVDNSGSMKHTISNTVMRANQFANVLALTLLKTEPNAEGIAFNNKRETFNLGRRSSLDEAMKLPLIGGTTDCAIPIVHALATGNKYDAIIILSDNESWAGQQHGFQALAEYRKKINPDVKVVEVAAVATPYSTFPSDDKNLLRVVGFDASVLQVIEEFLK